MSCGKGSSQTADDRKRTLKTLEKTVNKMHKKKSGSTPETNGEFVRNLQAVFRYIEEDPGITISVIDKQQWHEKDNQIANLLDSTDSLTKEKNKLEEEKNNLLLQVTSCQEILSLEQEKLGKAFNEKTNEKERFEKEKTDLLAQIASYQEKKNKLSVEHDSLGKAFKEMTNQKERLEKEKANLEGEITSFQESEKWRSTEMNKLEKTLKEMTNEKERLEEKLASTERLLNDSIRDHEKEMKNIEDSLSTVQMENRSIQEKLSESETVCMGLTERVHDLEKKLNKEKEYGALKDQRLVEHEAKLEDMSNSLSDTQRMLIKQQHENEQMKIQFHQYIENQKMQFSESLQDQRRTIDKLQKSLSEEKKAKDNALNRLSAAAASRLRDQNPGITDLSDPNRPLKLAEKVSELYDNEWTNGMENLENELDIDESQGIKILLQIVKAIFSVCSKMGNQHLKSFSQILVLPSELVELNQSEEIAIPDLPPELIKPMKDFRKTHSDKAVELLQKYFKQQAKYLIGIDDNVIETCQEYVDKCIELCWMMRIQDPPIHMESSYATNSEFDASKMRSYTKAGKFVHFVVWPTFFLHENGPLLAKGVVQGTKTKVEDITDETNKPDPAAHNSNNDVDKQDPAAQNCNTEADIQDHVAQNCRSEADKQDDAAQNSGNETDKQDPAVHNSNHRHRDTDSSSSDEESYKEASTHPEESKVMTSDV